jgi:hypothetical protein
VFLGTPHHGALLERIGNWINGMMQISPYSAPLARIGNIRSACITDLRYGYLLDEDWMGVDPFTDAGDRRRPLPLPTRVRCYTIAGSLSRGSGTGDFEWGTDGLVEVDSALGLHRQPEMTLSFAKDRQWIAQGINHCELLANPTVYSQIRGWLETDSRTTAPV